MEMSQNLNPMGPQILLYMFSTHHLVNLVNLS